MSDESMYTAMREFIREAVKVEVLKAAPLATRSQVSDDPVLRSVQNFMDAVESRLERYEAENRSAPLAEGDVPVRAWGGVWRETRTYDRGILATHNGATWVATRPTGLKPGTGDSGWKMIAKGIGVKDL